MEQQPNNNYNQALWKEIPWDFTEDCSLSLSGTTFLIVAYSAVLAVGLVGNSCLVFVIVRHKEMRNVTNILIANLSVSDILMCIVCLPVTIIYTLMDRWILGESLCKLTPFIQCISVSVSIFSLVLIAMERYQLIVHPTGWKPMARQSYLAVALTWITACLISVPFIKYSILTLPFQNLTVPFPINDQLVCMEQWPSIQARQAYTTSLLIFQYFLPLFLILLCYLHIYLRLRRRKDMVERGRNTTQKNKKGTTRINVLLTAIVVAFALSWLPLNIFNTVFDWNHEVIPSCGHNIIFSFCHLIAMASTCINPIIYGFLNNNFQKQLKSTLLHCRCWGVAERYESVPLSTVSTEVTKGYVLSNGSNSINT
ncbi:neuropeptide Y receptor Y8b isoform X1 [Syngnathoides biaculeatus]|uniref:neuropeptide Y receptor Y8b isoform X1 n=2 Tax=Syngnathoides biaculeatus TaxID=300417 RepID=UPI002ADE7A2A|nr:neuropeptide Y receptor Y8b isoform X1 [Syngnathoides biaculeatus]XP_061672885.1 neuropeptide Y receptor Y8b isoform X1 [Syngnathoides biaculeatus]XP_061672886.1 neuropeptide Y receptor Y8b isoform X1 [Syngnathoides biaculeatus]XP_061672887.1 neuropeptide Y receptor Y8b isoform X1 [Syngnathoides biaculeatus]